MARQCSSLFQSVLADDVFGQGDAAFEHLLQAEADRFERIARIDFAFRTSHVRGEDHGAVFIQAVVDRRDGRADAAVVGDVSELVQRYVEITADKNFFVLQIKIFDVEKLHASGP